MGKHGASTRYKVDSIFRAFSKWLYEMELVERNPMDRIPRPRRLSPDEVPLRAVSGADVRRLFDACRTPRELLTISTIAYLGARRGAVSKLRWRDVDLDRGWATLHEKGGKVHEVALPDNYVLLLQALIDSGAVTPEPNGYVVPMACPQRRSGERDNRVIWRIAKDVEKRAGLTGVFPHALRHSFSVRFLETHPGEVEALQRMLGHARMETTARYTRAMERMRLDMSAIGTSVGTPDSMPWLQRRGPDSNRCFLRYAPSEGFLSGSHHAGICGERKPLTSVPWRPRTAGVGARCSTQRAPCRAPSRR